MPNVVVALNLLVEDVLLDNEVPKVVVAEKSLEDFTGRVPKSAKVSLLLVGVGGREVLYLKAGLDRVLVRFMGAMDVDAVTCSSAIG